MGPLGTCGSRCGPGARRGLTVRDARFSAGFSLLEALVAMALLGILLGGLYQALVGATRNVRLSERYSYAVILAESLLDDYAARATGEQTLRGSTEDYQWSVQSRRLVAPSGGAPGLDRLALYRVDARVGWGLSGREVLLSTIVQGATPAVEP